MENEISNGNNELNKTSNSNRNGIRNKIKYGIRSNTEQGQIRNKVTSDNEIKRKRIQRKKNKENMAIQKKNILLEKYKYKTFWIKNTKTLENL